MCIKWVYLVILGVVDGKVRFLVYVIPMLWDQLSNEYPTVKKCHISSE